MTTIGVDPGLKGALVKYDKATDMLEAIAMPTMLVTVNKRKRARLDAVEMLNFLSMQMLIGVDIMVMEAVAGRKHQGAGAGIVYGFEAGVIYGISITLRLPVETVAPAIWKRILKVPGKALGLVGDVIKRADTLLPNHTSQWRGPRGGLNDGIAEAAMLAYFGEHFVLESTRPAHVQDPAFRLAYGGIRHKGWRPETLL
jgi:hypothetical protein